MASHVLNEIFDKLHSSDKDFRFMATSDLLTELRKDTVRLDNETERRVCQVVLQRMQDTAGEISELAVRCLSVLLPKIHEANLVAILKTLCDNFLSERKDHEGREMTNLGIKTVIDSIAPHSMAATTVIGTLTPLLIKGIESQNDEIVLMALDIGREFVIRFGSALESHGALLLKVFLALLSEPRAVTRKKAISCIGVLSLSLPDGRLHELFTMLLENINRSDTHTQLITSHVQAIGVVSYVVGNRVGEHIETGVQFIMALIHDASEEDVELLESCLRSLESFVSRSPLFALPYLDPILESCINFLHFDPNFADDSEENEDEEMQTEEEEDDIYSDEEGYSDDEDESWKVRKAAASCLTAVFASNVEQMHLIYPKVGPVLIGRFSEREENVKLDILTAFISLIHFLRRCRRSYGGFDMDRVLESSVLPLMKSIGKQLREKSVKARLHVFKVLKEVAVVLPEQTVQNLPSFVPAITKALREGSSSASDLKIEVLSFLRVAMVSSPPTDFQSALPQFAQAVFSAVQERYYKVTAEALRACNAMVHVLRPSPQTILDDAAAELTVPLFDAVFLRLKAQDVDQEVKEYAIRCVGDLIAKLGDGFSDQVLSVMRVLLDRLKSETTRLTAAKALSVIGGSSLELDLKAMVPPIITELTLFLKKANVSLRQAALDALNVYCLRSGASFESDVVYGIIAEAAPLVCDRDLHLASNSLDLLCTLVQVCPPSKGKIQELVIPRVLDLIQSPLLQGSALTSLQAFFVSMSDHFQQLFDLLLIEVPGKVQQLSTARCLAALCCKGAPSALPSSVQTLVNASSTAQSELLRRLGMLSLGEIGRLNSLSGYPRVESLITEALQDPSEDIKSAASYALGALTLGNLEQYLPALVAKIRSSRQHPRQLYLLLQSLDEVISSLNRSDSPYPMSTEHVEEIRDMLLASTDFEEDCRNVAAECVGELALLNPPSMLPSLRSNIRSPSENIRYMIVAGIRHAIVERPHPVDQDLQGTLALYLESLRDDSRHVRKAAVQLFSSALAHKYRLVQDCFQDVLPDLYAQTEKRQELVRVLDFGPFKHRIDDGIELRKATFESMSLLLDVALARVNIQEFLPHLQKGLADENDIKLLCYPMLIKLCAAAEGEVLSAVDRLVDPLQKTLSKKLPTDAVKHEKERHQELQMSCLKAVDVLNSVEGIAVQKGFKSMMDNVVRRGELKVAFQEIQKERQLAREERKTAHDQAKLFSVLSRGLSHSMSL